MRERFSGKFGTMNHIATPAACKIVPSLASVGLSQCRGVV